MLILLSEFFAAWRPRERDRFEGARHRGFLICSLGIFAIFAGGKDLVGKKFGGSFPRGSKLALMDLIEVRKKNDRGREPAVTKKAVLFRA